MRPLELSDDFTKALGRLREQRLIIRVYGLRHEDVWPEAKRAAKPLLDAEGLPNAIINQYNSFARELTKHCRTADGDRLVRDIEVTLRKWRDLGFDLALLQRVALACLDAFSSFQPRRLPRRPAKKARHGKRSYAEAVEAGVVPSANPKRKPGQVKDYEQAMARNKEVSGRVRAVLLDNGVPAREFIRYNAFAYRVDRAARRYAGRSLAMAVANFTDEWESKGLRRDVLRAVCREVFGVEAETPDAH